MSGSETEDSSVLLREQELEDVESDEFGHTAYVDTLERVLHEANPPWHIGLFGTWGTGKSSIVNLLYDRIETGDPTSPAPNAPSYDFQDTVAVSINAWEHSGESIRTSLLLDLNRDLDRKIGSESWTDGDEWGLLPSEKIMRTLYDVQEKEDRAEHRTRREAFTAVLPELAVGFLGVLVLLVVVPRFTPVTPFEIGMAALAGGLFTVGYRYLISEYRDERVTKQRRMVNPRNEWAGAYADLFEEILTEAQQKFNAVNETDDGIEHFVITIDDLDRCESASVYETLIALKSFMKHDHCTYIIPCDEEALYRHVKAADSGEYLDQRENQQHFLAKFFETRLRIPEIEGDVLETYAKQQADELDSDVALDDAIIDDVIMASNPSTPRRILQAINKITTYRILAEAREEFDAIDTDDVEDMKFLAKILLLQENYPEFYAALERNEIALESLYAAQAESSDNGRAAISEQLHDLGIDESVQDDLIDFLVATREIDQDPEPFLHLTGSELSAAERFENALEQGRLDDLREMADDADTTLEGVFVETIEKALGDEDTRYEAFPVILQILNAFDHDTHQESITMALYAALDAEDHTALLEGIDLNDLGPCIERLSDGQQTDLLGWYVDAAVSEASVSDQNLRSLLNIGPRELEQLYDVREQFATNLADALDAGTITKPEYDEIVNRVCRDCPQLYSEQLVREGVIR
ncbi:KAP family P-loop NTPase fold protein [Halarchaeum sp. P4]|uniref:KAP family P-loop NTPase fold protein n=1 Tax=Halarchaeum sp. P4 TaxID=3421639 RepID=UPI003EC09CAD